MARKSKIIKPTEDTQLAVKLQLPDLFVEEILLPGEEFDAMVEVMNNPPEPTEALINLMTKPVDYNTMPILEKVALMSDLRAVLYADDVKKAISSKPAGQKVYDVFKAAIEQEIGKMMTAEPQNIKEEAPGVLNEYHSAIQSLSSTIDLFNQQELLMTLKVIAHNMPKSGNSQAPYQQQKQVLVSSQQGYKAPAAKPVDYSQYEETGWEGNNGVPNHLRNNPLLTD